MPPSSDLGKNGVFRIYKHFIQAGGHTPNDPYMGMMQALHDNSITHCIYKLIGKRQTAAIMGDHKMGARCFAQTETSPLVKVVKGIIRITKPFHYLKAIVEEMTIGGGRPKFLTTQGSALFPLSH